MTKPTIPHINSCGPRLLSAFGMGGVETQTWGVLIRKSPLLSERVSELITSKQPRLVVAKFDSPRQIVDDYLDYDPEKLGLEIILDVTI